MYLKRLFQQDGVHYVLSESYRAADLWRHRRLVDLGLDPGEHIEYPGGNAFYVKEALVDRLQEMNVHVSSDDLEHLFLPFIQPQIRRVVETFDRGTPQKAGWRRWPQEKLLAAQRRLHGFDKRRLHYLRCGRVDIGNLDGRVWPFLNRLLHKSRDEIESVVEGMEQQLAPHEMRPYLYAALDLQRHFRRHPLRNTPAGLDPERLDELFVESLCRLNRDPTFFTGLPAHDPDSLHAYLVRYLLLHFDTPFDTGMIWDDYVRQFMGRRRFYRTPPRGPTPAADEARALKCLGLSAETFRKMTRRELGRRYRRLAKRTHPDRGGAKERFVEIKEAYECLLFRKP